MSNKLIEKKHGLKKTEILRSKKKISLLFQKSKSFYSKSMILRYNIDNSLENTQVIFVVPKRIYKLAVTRNLIKRRIKEAYRLNKLILNELKNFFTLAFIFRTNEKEAISFIQIQSDVIFLLQQLVKIEKKI